MPNRFGCQLSDAAERIKIVISLVKTSGRRSLFLTNDRHSASECIKVNLASRFFFERGYSRYFHNLEKDRFEATLSSVKLSLIFLFSVSRSLLAFTVANVILWKLSRYVKCFFWHDPLFSANVCLIKFKINYIANVETYQCNWYNRCNFNVHFRKSHRYDNKLHVVTVPMEFSNYESITQIDYFHESLREPPRYCLPRQAFDVTPCQMCTHNLYPLIFNEVQIPPRCSLFQIEAAISTARAWLDITGQH